MYIQQLALVLDGRFFGVGIATKYEITILHVVS